MAEERRSLQDLIRRRQQAGFVGRQKQIIQYRENLALSVDDLRRRFLFNIHGDAGVGKTYLTKQLHRNATDDGALSAYIDETAEDAVSAMVTIAEEFARAGARLNEFDKRVIAYRQRRDELESDPHAPDGVAAFITKAAVTVAFAAARDVPVAGSLLAPIDPATVADQANRARAYLARKFNDRADIRLLLSPADELTTVFVTCLNRVAENRHIALFFDTYERTAPTLDRWLRDLYVGRYGDLPATLVTTVSGQYPLNLNLWGDYFPIIADVPLEPFSASEAHQFLASKDIVDTSTIDVIINLSGRLPMWLATLADVRPKDAADVGDPAGDAVGRFLKWEEDPTRRTIAIAASLPRAFNQDVMNAITPSNANFEVFSWLCSMPFVAQKGGFWKYHDVVRSAMLRLQRAQSPSEWRLNHLALAEAHDKWASEAVGDSDAVWSNQSWINHSCEKIYHLLCADPVNNINQALISTTEAAAHGNTHAYQWARLLTDAARDTDDPALAQWSRRLTGSLDDDSLIGYFNHLIDDGHLDNTSLAIALQKRCEGYRKISRYDEALADISRVLTLDPSSVPAIIRRGSCYRLMGLYEDALTDLNRAVELAGSENLAFRERGEVYFSIGRYSEAFADLNRAIELDSSDEGSILIRGLLYLGVGSRDKALSDFDRAVELNPSSEWSIASRGLGRMLEKRMDAALADFDRAIELDPKNGMSVTFRGLGYLMTGRYREALVDFDRIIEFDPTDGSALIARSSCYYAIGRYNDALADINRGIELGINDVALIAVRGLIYMSSRRNKEALADFGYVINIAPNLVKAIVGRGMAYSTMGRHDDALADFDRALELEPDNILAIVGRGTAYSTMGRHDDALADFDRALELEPDNILAIADRGTAYSTMGRHDDALADFDHALELDPGDNTIIVRRGAAYSTMGRHDDALADFDHALELDPDNIPAILARVAAYNAMGRHDETLADFERSLELDPDNIPAILARGGTYDAMGRHDEALADFNHVLELDPDNIPAILGRGGRL